MLYFIYGPIVPMRRKDRKKIMKPELYILLLNNSQYYTGSTNNLIRRLAEHQSGQTASTRHKLPCKLVFHQTFDTILEARKLEIFIKKQKSRIFIEKIISGHIKLQSILGGR